LEEVWKNPEKSEEIIPRVTDKNKKVHEFEKMLETK